MKSQLNARWSEVDLAVVVVVAPVAVVVDVFAAAVVAVVVAVPVAVPAAVTATNPCHHKYPSAAVVVHLLKILVKPHSVHSKLLWPLPAQLGIRFHRIIRIPATL